MGWLRLGLQRGLALGSALALLMALAGFSLIAPVALASDFTSCPTVTDLQDVMTTGGTLSYTGLTACSIPLSSALTVASGVSVAIDGGTAGLTLTNTSDAANLVNAASLSSGQSLTLNHVTLVTGDSSQVIDAHQVSGAIMLTNSTITTGDYSTGINAYQAGGAITVTNCTLIAGDDSNSIYADIAHGAIRVTNSTLTVGDVNSYGIDAHQATSAITLTNSTITAGYESYGIDASAAQGAIRVTNSTLTFGDYSTGVDASDVTKPVTITASILAGTGGSNSTNCFGTIIDGGYNLSASSDDTCGFASSTKHSRNVTTSQLNLQPLADNGGPTRTQALGSGSVAIDAIPVNGQGNCAVGEQTDQRGVPRPQGSGCDTGAFEVVQSTTLSVCPDQPRLQGYLDSTPADGSDYTITLPKNCVVTLQNHGLSVGAGVNVTINGNGLTIDGQGGSFDIIDVNDSNSHPSGLALDQVTLQNGASGVVESHGTGMVLLTDSTIRNMTNGNQISYGVDANTVSLTRSTVNGITGTAGATVYAVSGINVTLNASTISGVSGSNSAAGVFALGSASVTSSTISGIAGSGSSFGVLTLGSGAVISSTITQVTASGAGSPSFGVANGGSSLTLQASLLAGNGQSCGGSVIDGGYNLATDPSCNFASDSTSKTVTDNDLNLRRLADNGGSTETIALGPGSVAIDAIPLNQGQCVAGVSADQRDVARPQGPGCDVGAYETTNSAGLLPGSTTTVRQGFYALIRVEALSPFGQNISSRNLNVTSVELDGPNDQVIPFTHQFQFGRFAGQPGYQLAINTRNLARGDWTLLVQFGNGQTATTGWVTFTVQ